MKPFSIGAIIFFAFFVLYLFTSGPGLAPYRDSGEMVSVIKTLGVAHPPGYPLYTVLGHLSTFVPWGSHAYKVTLFSSMAGAMAVALLFRLLAGWVSFLPALLAALMFGFSRSFWDLATVPEMYTLGILMLVAALNALVVDKNPFLFAFFMGLSLGARMDFILILPILAVAAVPGRDKKSVLLMAVCFAVGLSILLYLPVRSRQNPWLDWGNPETLGAMLNSLSRKSYSGTLDLLSLSYAKGENFFSTLRLYGTYLWVCFGLFGLMTIPVGVDTLYRQNKKVFWITLGLFIMTGPLFFFLANMPPNPHAVAILEASYLVPDLSLAVFAAFGLKRLKAVVLVACLLTGVNAVFGYQHSNKRNNFVLQDYVANVRRSAPANAVVVMKKDVQLFALWHEQLVLGRRRDLSLVSIGLSGSPWFWDMKKRWPTARSPEISLKDASGWPVLLESSGGRPVLAGYETDLVPTPSIVLSPRGFLVQLNNQNDQGLFLLKHMMLDRTRRRYGETPDFFSTDLIGDAARAYQFQGHHLMNQNRYEDAVWFFHRSQWLDPTAPQSVADEAYLRFSQNQFSEAAELSVRAAALYEENLGLTRRYKSLPGVVGEIKSEYINTLVMAGAASERTQGKNAARAFYKRSLDVMDNAQAHYNLGVTYWNEDWTLAYQHMKRAAELNPSMTGVQNYLAMAAAKLRETAAR